MALVALKSDALNRSAIALLLVLFFVYCAQLYTHQPLLVCEADVDMRNCVPDGAQSSVDRNAPNIKYPARHNDIFVALSWAVFLPWLPTLIWNFCFQPSCDDLASFLDGIQKDWKNIDFHEAVIKLYTERFMDLVQSSGNHMFWRKKRISRSYLVLKCIFFMFSGWQLYLMSSSLEGCSLYEGLIMLTFYGDDEAVKRFFPSIVKCEYPANVKRWYFSATVKYTTCELKGNAYAAQMFRLLSVFHLVMLVLNGLFLFERLLRFSRTYRGREIDNFLNGLGSEDKVEFERQKLFFKEEYLSEDGSFFLELLACNVSRHAAGVICRRVFVHINQAVV